MPELPEVETIRKTLKRFVVNQSIEYVHVHWPNIVKVPNDTERFKHLLVGQTIHDIGRKGKFLLFELDDYTLVSHLRMEGKYSVHPQQDPIKKHTHIIFSFTNGEELRYNDVRKFGTMHLFKKGEEQIQKPLNQLGPDPFEETFTYTYFSEKLQRTSRAIKTALLDQSIVSGLGNIYVDETLFKANIHPLKRANELTPQEVKLIQEQATKTLRSAVEKGGTTIRSYVNGQGDMGMFQQDLFVYGKENEPCQTCSRPIVKIKVGGRGTHLCTICQR